MLTRIYKEYLMYLFGELTEYHSEKYPDSRFWKNDEYGVVLELRQSGALWVSYKIWDNFSMFFSLQHSESQQVIKTILEEHLKLGKITSVIRVMLSTGLLEEHLKSII